MCFFVVQALQSALPEMLTGLWHSAIVSAGYVVIRFCRILAFVLLCFMRTRLKPFELAKPLPRLQPLDFMRSAGTLSFVHAIQSAKLY
jgi:hypothetical protein